jgi:hypothetical protein
MLVVSLLVLVLVVPLAVCARRALRWTCPACAGRRGVVIDDLWDRCWGLQCRDCGFTWEERC